MVNVNVTVYKDESAIYPSGCSRSVSSESQVFSVEKVEMTDYPLGCDENPAEYKMLLKIVDPNSGILWIDDTAQSFADKIAAAISGSAGAPPTFQFTIGDGGANTPANGATQYVNADLASATKLKVEKNGFGTLTEGVDYSLLGGGGYTLLAGGIFTTGETWFVWILE